MTPTINCWRNGRDFDPVHGPPRAYNGEAPTVQGQGFVGGGAGRRSPSPKNTTRKPSRKRLPTPRFRRLPGGSR
jgi:hypothetical protein